MTGKNGEPPEKAPVPRQDRGFLHLGVSLPRFVTVRQPIFNHSPTAFQPPVVRFSPLVRPTFCRTHSPTSHPHFTYSAHTTHPPRRHSATVLQPPNNQFPIIFQSPLNHHSHAPRPRLLPSAATRTDILFPPTPRRPSATSTQPQPSFNHPHLTRIGFCIRHMITKIWYNTLHGKCCDSCEIFQ